MVVLIRMRVVALVLGFVRMMVLALVAAEELVTGVDRSVVTEIGRPVTSLKYLAFYYISNFEI